MFLNHKYIFIFNICCLVGFSQLSGVDPSEDRPIRKGGIVDTNSRILVDSKMKKKAQYGFQEIFIRPGESAVLDVNRFTKVEDIEFFPTKKDIIVNGEKDPTNGYRVIAGTKTGNTQIYIYDKKSAIVGKPFSGKLLKVYSVTVSGTDLLALMQEIRALIGQIEGVEIRIVGERVVIDGAVIVAKDMRRISAVLSGYAQRPVLNLVEVSPLSFELVARKMEEEINGGKNRPKDIRVKVVNGRYYLEGQVDREADRQVAVRICQSYFPERYQINQAVSVATFDGLPECINLVRRTQPQSPPPDRVISVRTDFVTLTKNYEKAFDFRWNPGFSDGGSGNVSFDSTAGRFLSSFTATIRNLFPRLSKLSRHGYARVLKSAHILVRDGDGPNGQPPLAKMSENIEIGVQVVNPNTGVVSSDTRNVTTEISLRARSAGSSDRINLQIDATVSEILSETGVPTTKSNSVSTTLVVTNGESAALGGLITERRSYSNTRSPGAEAGVQFNVFDIGSNKSFSNSKEQFVIFVTPKKLRTPEEGTQELKRKFRLKK